MRVALVAWERHIVYICRRYCISIYTDMLYTDINPLVDWQSCSIQALQVLQAFAGGGGGRRRRGSSGGGSSRAVAALQVYLVGFSEGYR